MTIDEVNKVPIKKYKDIKVKPEWKACFRSFNIEYEYLEFQDELANNF